MYKCICMHVCVCIYMTHYNRTLLNIIPDILATIIRCMLDYYSLLIPSHFLQGVRTF